MSDATIVCPHCQSTFPLTESLAGPLLAVTRRKYEDMLLKKDADVAEREKVLRLGEERLAADKQAAEQRISAEVNAKLTAERTRLIEEEARKARLAAAADLDAKDPRARRPSRHLEDQG